MGNPFVHVELSTDDLNTAKKFYKGLFQWKLQDMKMGPGYTYTMLDAGKNKTGGGMTKKMMEGQATSWLPYVEVDDVKKTIARAKSLGAQIVQDYQPVGDMGAIAVFVDPTGAALGVWETAKKAPARKTASKAAKKPAAKKKKSRR